MEIRETTIEQERFGNVDNEDNTCFLSSQYAVEGDDGLMTVGKLDPSLKKGTLPSSPVGLWPLILSLTFLVLLSSSSPVHSSSIV